MCRQDGLRRWMAVGWMIMLSGGCGIEGETGNAEKERSDGPHLLSNGIDRSLEITNRKERRTRL